MTDRVGRALRQLRGGVVPVLDEASGRARRERIAAHVLRVSLELSARRERRRRLGLGVALAALVAGACAVLLVPGEWLRPQVAGVSSEVRLVAGHASLQQEGGRLEALAPGEHALGQDAVLVTPAEESAELLLSSQTTVSVAPKSRVAIRRQRPAPDVFEERVRLRAGGVALRVPELGARGRVSVETLDALVEVHGTQFSVRVVERAPLAPYTEVRVREGRVMVRSGDERRLLRGGDFWSSRHDAAPAPAVRALPEAPEPEVAPRDVDRSKPRARSPGAARTPPSELAAQNRLLEAAKRAQRSGLIDLAVQRLDALIARYPDAELAHNARVERFRVLELAGRHGEAAAAAREYLERHPTGFAREEAERLSEHTSQAAP